MLQTPYLRTSRSFPPDIEQLSMEINKAYIDTANAVNVRTSGLYPSNRSVVNGEAWYVNKNQKMQGIRQVYTFTTAPTTIEHGITTNELFAFVRVFGMYMDASGNWFGIVAGSNTAIAGQISAYIDPTNINILSGAGAPTATYGIVTLEWISNV
jgi:hypothetical protein